MKQADITLRYNGIKYGLYLADGVKSISESSAEESTFNARFSRGKKKYGEDPLLTLAEFRDWTGGRGVKNTEDDATGYADGLAWTLSPGMVVPTPQWHIANGLRAGDYNMPGNMSWTPLLGHQSWISTPFVASSAYSAANIWLFIKRYGTPSSDLTVGLYSDNAGEPGTLLQSATKDTGDITDYIDVFTTFTITAQALVLNNTYHIVVHGDTTDNGESHWEIGVSKAGVGSLTSTNGGLSTWTITGQMSGSTPPEFDPYRVYFRVTEANSATGVSSKKFLFFNYSGSMYAVTRPASGNSALYKWDDTTSAFITTGFGTPSITAVTGRPLVAGVGIYFPQGATATQKWNGSTTWSPDGSNLATMLQNYYDYDNSKAKIVALKDNNVTLGDVPATFGDVTYGTAIPIGDAAYPITNSVVHQNKLWVFKQDQMGIVYADKYSLQDSNYKFTPSARNGAAVLSWNGLLYFSWLNTIMESYSGTANDVGQAWRGQGPASERAGYISCALGINAWRFFGMDAGASGYSSVQVYNGLTTHEIYRAPYGHRIRDIWWEHVDLGHSRLFIDCDYEVVYLEFARDVANPTIDKTHNYAHSFYIVTPTFDDGAARLSKYVKSITASVTNCQVDRDAEVYFEVDYQTDNNVGEDGAENWFRAGRVFNSPEGTLKMNLGNRRCIRVRIRGYTDKATVPPQLDAITMDGFTRTPARKVWSLKVKVNDKKKASELLEFLYEASMASGDITIESTIPELNGRHVIATRPRVARELLKVTSQSWTGTMTFSFMDMTE